VIERNGGTRAGRQNRGARPDIEAHLEHRYTVVDGVGNGHGRRELRAFNGADMGIEGQPKELLKLAKAVHAAWGSQQGSPNPSLKALDAGA